MSVHKTAICTKHGVTGIPEGCRAKDQQKRHGVTYNQKESGIVGFVFPKTSLARKYKSVIRDLYDKTYVLSI